MLLYITISFLLFWGMFWGCQSYKNDNPSANSTCAPKNEFISIERMFFFLFLLLFTFLTAMRSANIGNDTQNYVTTYRYICKYGLNSEVPFEIGYQLFCVLVSKISTDPHVFLIITALFCYGMVGVYSLLYSSNLYITICLIFCFCFSPFTNILRQDMAMVICLFAYQALKRDRTFLFCFIVLLAMQFHGTAICMYALLLKRFFPQKFTTVLIISSVLILLSCLGMVSDVFIGMTKYDSYFLGDRVGSGWLGTALGVFKALFIYFIIANDGIDRLKNNDKTLYGIFFLLVAFSALGFQMNMFNRCALYFSIISITEIPNTLKVINGNKAYYGVISFCLISLVNFIIVLIFRPEWNSLTPYRMW